MTANVNIINENLSPVIIWDLNEFCLTIKPLRSNYINRISGHALVRCSGTSSALLEVHCSETSSITHIVLDLQATTRYIEEEGQCNDSKRSYVYTRQDECLVFEFVSQCVSDKTDVVVHKFAVLEYLFDQFCRRITFAGLSVTSADGYIDTSQGKEDLHHPQSNVVARAAETAGTLIRKGLKTTGSVTGKAIRQLGNHHSDAATRALSAEELERETKRAEAVLHAAETAHSCARVVSGAIMTPVRYVGRRAVQLTSQHVSAQEEGWKRAVIDTVGGCGNGIMSVAKGVTEGLAEVGTAIGETALHRSTRLYGSEYAQSVTDRYVRAGGEACRAAYKTASVASMGLDEVALGMAVEGIDYAVNLDDYLVGPVLVQGYIYLSQSPQPAKRYFAVLRPWSIAFYSNPGDFTSKPSRLIATSCLDTLPRLRLPKSPENSRRTIELCTVDASTFTLHSPCDYMGRWSVDRDEELVGIWYIHLQEACRRVESISKYRSGAMEIAERLYLRTVPRGIGWIWKDDYTVDTVLEDWIYSVYHFSLKGGCIVDNANNESESDISANIEILMEATGRTYTDVKEALESSNGEVDWAAEKLIVDNQEKETSSSSLSSNENTANDNTIHRLKELVSRRLTPEVMVKFSPVTNLGVRVSAEAVSSGWVPYNCDKVSQKGYDIRGLPGGTATWPDDSVIELGNEVRIHRDTCSYIHIDIVSKVAGVKRSSMFGRLPIGKMINSDDLRIPLYSCHGNNAQSSVLLCKILSSRLESLSQFVSQRTKLFE